MKKWARLIAPDQSQAHFEWISLMSVTAFYAVFIPLFLVEMIFFKYGFSVVVATVVCCWFVFKVCRIVSVTFESMGLVHSAFFFVLRMSLVIVLSPSIIVFVIGSFVEGLFHLVHGVPLAMTMIGFCLIRRDHVAVSSNDPDY